ncbi:MAG: hypothetical protein LBF81_01515, partial [Prevotellaceae bacterium]|nr:hypothetical protein [Prevotellaceae bacterium]
NVTPVTVYNWMRSYGKDIIDKIRNPRPVQTIEWNEMRYYGNSQKTMEGFGVVLIEKESQTLVALKQKEEQGQH